MLIQEGVSPVRNMTEGERDLGETEQGFDALFLALSTVLPRPESVSLEDKQPQSMDFLSECCEISSQQTSEHSEMQVPFSELIFPSELSSVDNKGAKILHEMQDQTIVLHAAFNENKLNSTEALSESPLILKNELNTSGVELDEGAKEAFTADYLMQKMERRISPDTRFPITQPAVSLLGQGVLSLEVDEMTAQKSPLPDEFKSFLLTQEELKNAGQRQIKITTNTIQDTNLELYDEKILDKSFRLFDLKANESTARASLYPENVHPITRPIQDFSGQQINFMAAKQPAHSQDKPSSSQVDMPRFSVDISGDKAYLKMQQGQLGEVRAKIEIHHHQSSVTLIVDNNELKQMVQNQLPQLKQLFADAEMVLVQANVEEQTRHNTPANREETHPKSEENPVAVQQNALHIVLEKERGQHALIDAYV